MGKYPALEDEKECRVKIIPTGGT